MLKAVLVVLQTLLFLILFALGSFLPIFTPLPAWQIETGPHRFFVFDGVVFALLAFLLILVIEASRRRLRGAGALTTLALVLGLALGLAMKLGFKTA